MRVIKGVGIGALSGFIIALIFYLLVFLLELFSCFCGCRGCGCETFAADCSYWWMSCLSILTCWIVDADCIFDSCGFASRTVIHGTPLINVWNADFIGGTALLTIGGGFTIGFVYGFAKQIQEVRDTPMTTTTVRSYIKYSIPFYIIMSILTIFLYFFITAMEEPLLTRETNEYYEQLPTISTQVISHQYLDARNFSEGLAAVRKGNLIRSKWGFVDKEGNEVIPFEYDAVMSFKNGVANVRVGSHRRDNWMLIDQTGNVIDAQGQNIEYSDDEHENIAGEQEATFSRTHSPLYGVKVSHRDGFATLVDNNGKEIIRPGKYLRLRFIADDLLAAWIVKSRPADREWAVIDIDGNVIVNVGKGPSGNQPKYSEGFILSSRTGQRIFYDRMGRRLTDTTFRNASLFSEGLAAVSLDGTMWGYIDTDGNEVIPYIYDSAQSFIDGLALVRQDGKSGFINAAGNIVIPLIYDSAQAFTEDFAVVSKNGMFGFIDRRGNTVIPLTYNDASSFDNGIAAVRSGNSFSQIDSSGNELFAFKIDESLYSLPNIRSTNSSNIQEVDETGASVLNTSNPGISPIFVNGEYFLQLQKPHGDGYRFGFINESGDIVIPFIYTNRIFVSEGMAAVLYDGRWGFISIG